MAIGPDIPAAPPAIIPTVRIGAEMVLGIHLARTSTLADDQRWRRRECWIARLLGLRTDGTGRLMSETRKGLGLSGVFLRQLGWLGRCLVRCGSALFPDPRPAHAQPQDAYQHDGVNKVFVYHSVSPILWENDDRLPVS